MEKCAKVRKSTLLVAFPKEMLIFSPNSGPNVRVLTALAETTGFLRLRPPSNLIIAVTFLCDNLNQKQFFVGGGERNYFIINCKFTLLKLTS